MLNSLINGIAIKLRETFGSEYKIHREDVEQGLKEPCFIIQIVEPMQSAKLPNRYLRQYSFDVLYFPKSTSKPKYEMYDVAEKLLIELEYVTVNQNNIDNLVRGTKMQYEIVDNVLHFFVNYDFFVKKDTIKKDFMEDLTIKPIAED